MDAYDLRPEEMDAYLRHNGWHFNKKMCEWAVRQMKKKNPATGKEEKIEPWSKEQVEEMMARHGIKLESNVGYDFVFVANMAKADFYKSSLPDEASVAKYVRDVVDDADQADGFILNRFYADCVRNGMPVPWEEVV